MNLRILALVLGLTLFACSGVLLRPAVAAEVPEARADKALVIFYRVQSPKGAAVGFNVKQGQGAIGTLSSGTTFHRYIDPGQHSFWTAVIS